MLTSGRLSAAVAVIAIVAAAAVAALLALVRGGEFVGSLRITALSIGALLLLMAGTGGGFSRAVDAEVQQSTLGRLPGVPAWGESRPDEPTISSAAVSRAGRSRGGRGCWRR